MTRKIITRADISKAAEPAIAEAKSAEEIVRFYPVMRELRTHLSTHDEFVERVERQQKDGYRIVYRKAGGKIRAVAGYRFSESLFAGRFLYVDDLVTSAKDRSAGFGGQLFDWLVRFARVQKCQHLELDSGCAALRRPSFLSYEADEHFNAPFHVEVVIRWKAAWKRSDDAFIRQFFDRN